MSNINGFDVGLIIIFALLAVAIISLLFRIAGNYASDTIAYGKPKSHILTRIANMALCVLGIAILELISTAVLYCGLKLVEYTGLPVTNYDNMLGFVGKSVLAMIGISIIAVAVILSIFNILLLFTCIKYNITDPERVNSKKKQDINNETTDIASDESVLGEEIEEWKEL